MTHDPYFDASGRPVDEPARLVRPDRDIVPLDLFPGIRLRPVLAHDVMASFVWIDAGVEAPAHHHVEQQLTILVSGHLTLVVSGEAHVLEPGDCLVIPPHAEHHGYAGPDGCHVIDVFTPPRAALLQYFDGERLKRD